MTHTTTFYDVIWMEITLNFVKANQWDHVTAIFAFEWNHTFETIDHAQIFQIGSFFKDIQKRKKELKYLLKYTLNNIGIKLKRTHSGCFNNQPINIGNCELFLLPW